MRLPVIRQRQRVQAVVGKGGGKLLRGLKVAVAAAENDDGLVGNGILPAAVKFGGQTVLRVRGGFVGCCRRGEWVFMTAPVVGVRLYMGGLSPLPRVSRP